jgi:hypothetical protein
MCISNVAMQCNPLTLLPIPCNWNLFDHLGRIPKERRFGDFGAKGVQHQPKHFGHQPEIHTIDGGLWDRFRIKRILFLSVHDSLAGLVFRTVGIVNTVSVDTDKLVHGKDIVENSHKGMATRRVFPTRRILWVDLEAPYHSYVQVGFGKIDLIRTEKINLQRFQTFRGDPRLFGFQKTFGSDTIMAVAIELAFRFTSDGELDLPTLAFICAVRRRGLFR